MIGGRVSAPKGPASRMQARALKTPTAKTRKEPEGTQPSAASTGEDKTGTQKIYIGKGRFIEDDPAKYPDKNQWAGGWAGGEAGVFRTCLTHSYTPSVRRFSCSTWSLSWAQFCPELHGSRGAGRGGRCEAWLPRAKPLAVNPHATRRPGSLLHFYQFAWCEILECRG